jgi:hypothetical protein
MTKPNRTQPPIIAPYLFQNALPLALLASDEPVMIGHLKLLRISQERGIAASLSLAFSTCFESAIFTRLRSALPTRALGPTFWWSANHVSSTT